MKLLLSVLLGLVIVGNAEAAQKKKSVYEAVPVKKEEAAASGAYGMAGCGLGSMAIKEDSKLMQVLAATLNGTGVQTFGISSGTSNCTESGVTMASREKEAFIEANITDLRRDIAVGKGEFLTSLASLYGCKGDSADAFAKSLHERNEQYMDANAQSMLKNIDATYSASLKGTCGA